MKSSSKCLKELIKNEGEDWKKKLSSYLKEEEADVENEELYSAFIDAYRENSIDNVQSELQSVSREIDNDLLMGELKEYITGILSGYYAAEPIRIMEKKNYEETIEIVNAVFEQCILRLNPKFGSSYEEYGFHMREDFDKVIYLLDSLVRFLVKRNLSKDAMAEVIYVNIRVSKKLCQYIADLTDKNFDKIQMRLIIDKVYES